MDAMYSGKGKKKKVEPKKQATGILDEVTKASTKKGKKVGAEKREELKGKKHSWGICQVQKKTGSSCCFSEVNMATSNS
jgi:hypothetical protein